MTISYPSLLLCFLPPFWFFYRHYRQHRICKSQQQQQQQQTAPVKNCCGDRLSRLPEDVLRHILSFLATDAAVKTSLLSARWRRVWASVPVLTFDSRRFHTSSSADKKFVRFVEKVVCGRNGYRIDTFRLTWHDGFDEDKAADWLSYACRRGVREIKLDVRPGEQCRLPTRMFRRCPSLEVCHLELPKKIWHDRPRPHLTTFYSTKVRLPSAANLAKLRVLHIKYIDDTDNLLGKLISACPALEDLTMLVSRDIEISAPNLRALTLSCSSTSNASTARVFAPRLTRLTCYLHGSPAILLDGLRCPVHANIVVSEEKIENKNNAVGLLRSLRLVKTLKLDDQLVQALPTLQDLSMQMEFNNLEYLRVKATLDSHNAKTIFMFLQGCPNLETLVIDNTKVSKQASRVATIFQLPTFVAKKAGHGDDWIRLRRKYGCSLSKLKRVTVDHFHGDNDELEFMNSFLWNASCLQEVRTNYRNRSSYKADHVRVTALLRSMITASSTAKFVPGYV